MVLQGPSCKLCTTEHLKEGCAKDFWGIPKKKGGGGWRGGVLLTSPSLNTRTFCPVRSATDEMEVPSGDVVGDALGVESGADTPVEESPWRSHRNGEHVVHPYASCERSPDAAENSGVEWRRARGNDAFQRRISPCVAVDGRF